VVVGGGIFGLSTALRLAESGHEVVVIERNRVGSGVTGRSTAKVTALHGAAYRRITQSHGADVAASYAAANQWGVAELARVAGTGDGTPWAGGTAYTYALSSPGVGEIEEEAAAAAAAGLPVELLADDIGLPFPVAAAVRLDDQGMVDPAELCRLMARALLAHGATVVSGCAVTDVSSKGRVTTARGVVDARTVVLATHLPILDRGGQFAATRPWQSYVIAASLSGPAPTGMYLGVDDAGTRSVRPIVTGGNRVLVGGEGHRTGRDPDAKLRLGALEEWARSRFPVEEVTHGWSAHDYESARGLPFAGRLPFSDVPIYAATGFAKWGFTNAAASARVVTDLIEGRAHPWPELAEDPPRTWLQTLGNVLRYNQAVATHFFGGRLSSGGALDDLEIGEGRVVKAEGRHVAASRDAEGNLQVHDARCTHLGCHVRWNAADATWDCPCHGSRFASDGSVVDGPATAPLRPVGDVEIVAGDQG
jgi:glycine/D-amino acid oxidase-like deaminating enzyme/nitrite reductase/ring-hydroxylating ferredoxin subunit